MHHRMRKIIGKVVAMALFAALAGSMPAAAAGARAAAGDADVPPNGPRLSARRRRVQQNRFPRAGP